MAASVYSRALQKAAELMGGYAKLARHLQVPADELQRWVRDEARPPMSVFLRTVDFILDETRPAESDPGDPPAPRDGAPAGDNSTRY